MIKVKSSRSFSFLIEFVIVLFFFCISALICVSIYSNSYRMNKEANHGKQALVYAQNYIESNEIKSVIEKEMFYLNEDFEKSVEEKRYKVKVEMQKEGTYEISVFEDGKKLITLPFMKEEVGGQYE